MHPRGYGNPLPPQDPHRPQDYPDRYQHPLHHVPQFPPAHACSTFPHPSSVHYPPAPGPPRSPSDNYPPSDAPQREYLQHSLYPPPPRHHPLYPPAPEPYPPAPEPYPPQYGFPHSPSVEAHQHSFSAHAYDRPTLGEYIPSPSEYAYTRPTPIGGKHSYPSSENTCMRPCFDHTHSPSFRNDTNSVRENEPQILERASVELLEPLPSSNVTRPPADVELPNGQLVRVFCKSNRSYNLGVNDGRVIMVEADSENESQQWIRDDKYSIRVRDIYGHPAFMLINKATKEVLKHANDKLQEVQLTYYSPDIQDDDLFWTESQDFGEGFKTQRMASDTLLNLSVGHGNKIKDGSPIILDTWHKKYTQLWKIFPL